MSNMLKKIIVAVVGLLSFFHNASAQDQSFGERLGNRMNELLDMIKIGQTYQSADLLSFDVSYDFADSTKPTVILEHKTGKCGMYNDMFWGSVDTTTEYVQGHQYYLVVDNQDKKIYVYDKLNYSRAINIPLLDSLFNEAMLLDLIITKPGGVYKKLTIKYAPGTQYKQVDMVYDSTTYLLSSIAYYYNTSIYSEAYNNCENSVTTLVVPATGVAMPSTVTCATLVKTYQNFLAEFPNHINGATVHMYVPIGGVTMNSIENNHDYAAAGQTDNEIMELWMLPQSVSGIARPQKDTMTPPAPKRIMKALAATGSWVDSSMTALQLFEWYMNTHLGVQYTGFVYTDWLANNCGYKLYQLPWSENTTVDKDALQNIWNSFTARYPASQLTISETVSVPIVKGVAINSLGTADTYDPEYIDAMTWTQNSEWFTLRTANTYNLSVLPKNAAIQGASLNMYAYWPSYRLAAHYRVVSQYPYMQIQPVKGLFIPGKTTVDLYPENSDVPAIGLPPTSVAVLSGPTDFWSNQDYLNQDVSSLVAGMYNNLQSTGVNYPVLQKLNEESYGTYKAYYFGGGECSDPSKKATLNVTYTASRCDVFTSFVNNALGTWLTADQVKDLFKYEAKLDISSDCTTATPGLGCDGEPGPGRPVTGITTISFNKTDESTFDLNLFGESRFFYKVGDAFYPQSNYSEYTIVPLVNNK